MTVKSWHFHSHANKTMILVQQQCLGTQAFNSIITTAEVVLQIVKLKRHVLICDHGHTMQLTLTLI